MLSKFSLVLFTFCVACNYLHPADMRKEQVEPYQLSVPGNPFKMISDIPLPNGYKRLPNTMGSFAYWLRSIDLKNDKTVYKFDGNPKNYQFAQFAVLNISVGKKDLQQCADAVMRLRAEYLYTIRKFDDIIFTDNNGTAYRYLQPYTRQNFDNYLTRVFGMCGSASLAKQLKVHIELKNIQPGDILIRGGFPGHAAIVMDVAANSKGEKIYLLAQSYMPAQDIHILNNPVDKDISPWYYANEEYIIKTPEYTFTKYELKRW